MADFKFPDDGTSSGTQALTSDQTILFPENRIGEGFLRSFEFKILGATSLDTNIVFKIFSGLNADVLDLDNILETITSVNLTGLTGNLVFQRDIINTLDTAFKVIISGTNASSTAVFLIRTRAE